MEVRDAIVFLLSTDWFYSSASSVSQVLPLKSREYEGLKIAARSAVKNLLSGTNNYYFSDFSERRLSGTLRDFLREIEDEVGFSCSFKVRDFISVILRLSSEFSGDLSVLRIAYAIGCRNRDGIYSPLRILCEEESVQKLLADNAAFLHAESSWDASLGSIFDGNESEVQDFYSAIVVPAFFVRHASRKVLGYQASRQEEVYDLLYSIVCDCLEFVISRERIVRVHEYAALP